MLALATPLVLGLGLNTPAQARRVAAPAMATPTLISVETLKSVTRELSDDRLAGRAPTSPEEEATINLIANRMKAAGLKAGYRGGWFQPVPMVEIDTHPQRIRFSGGAQPITLAWKTDIVVNSPRPVNQIALAQSPVVFVGYGINAPERQWNDYAGLDVRGKTVIVLVNDADWQEKTLAGPFGGRAMTYYGRWTYKFEEAARQGAAAVLIVHQAEPAAYGWDVVVSSWARAQQDLDDPDDRAPKTQAAGWITQDAARRLLAASGQNLDALTAQASRRGFRAVPLALTMDLNAHVRVARKVSQNVIGIQPGRSRPDEYVLYTAHWDHLGRCEAVNGDGICNGAVDNASGVAGLIALAQANVKAGAPERTQVFVAVTAEEAGLLGSRHYAEKPLFPLSQTVGGVNMDALNLNGPTRDVVIVGAGKSTIEDYVRREAAAQGRVVVAEPMPERGSYYRSDHFSLARGGVPMVAAGSGQDLVQGGRVAGEQAYLDYVKNRYHKPQDEYDPNWNWGGAVQDLTLYYRIGRALANGTDWPQWAKDSEFKAIRDRSRATGQ